MKRYAPYILIAILILVTALSGCGGSSSGPTSSANADLSALTVSDGTLVPQFDAAITSYTVSVANSVTSVTVTGTKTDANASASAPVILNNLVVGVAQTATIMVTAQNGATKTYTVAVTRVGTSTKAITAFSFASPAATGTIEENNHTITVTVPWGIDLNSQQLTPTIDKTGVSINPASGSPQYFNVPVTYTVTAQDGSTQLYTVTVTVASPSKVTVTYLGNNNTGGSAPTDNNDYYQGNEVTVLEGTNLERIPLAGTAEAFKFGGWNTQADGNGVTYKAGNKFEMTEDTTLYAKWIKFELRDTGPAGGLIFYDKGSFSGGWRYLEAALSDQSTGVVWGYSMHCGYTLTAIGIGKDNTGEIINKVTADGTAQYFNNNYAAKICHDFSKTNNGVTYSDWFLPSQEELRLMYTNLYCFGVGGLVTESNSDQDNCYWSSSEGSVRPDQFTIVMVITTQGGVGIYSRYNITRYCRVRACREF
jgi:hypothetical protein